MAEKLSAGLLMYRQASTLEVLLAHPGGPYFKNKDAGVWTLPKGEVAGQEDLLDCAKREFVEEIGISPVGPFVSLGNVRQKGGKVVHAWAFAAPKNITEPLELCSNTFELEWPPRSGKMTSFPEIDAAQFFTLPNAATKMNAAQTEFLGRLEAKLTERLSAQKESQ